MSFKRKLCKAFAAVAIFTGCLGAVATPAQAYTSVHVSTTAATSAAAAAAAAANARHNREAKNDVIVDPTPAHIERLKNRGLADWTTIPYIQEAVRDMHIKPGTQARDITEGQREHFMQLLKDKRLVAQMSADNAAGARAKGLSEGLAKYFDATKAELGYSGAVTMAQAQSMEKSMEAKHWENDTKPALKTGGMILGGTLVFGGGAYVLGRKRRNEGYGY